MKKSNKLVTKSLMAALVAIPAVAVPVAAIPTEAADVTPEQLVYTIDGQTFTIAYADYQDTLFDSESALAQLIADQTPVAIAVGDVYVDYTKYQDILFEGELEGIEALTAAVADETTHVAEEDQEDFDTTVEFDEDGNPVFNEPEPEKADLTAYNKAVAEAEALVEADYTAESYAVLAEALAVEITEESTQAEVDAAVAAINEAVAALVEATVADTEAPVITVDTAAITVENGATLTIPTATATDNVDETVEVTTTFKNAAGETVTAIDTKVAGTYTVTYTAVDAAGNEAEAKTVTVTVKAVGLAVESVSAINAKTLKVAVTQELENLEGLTFTAKRGTTAVVLTPTLSADKKSVELASSTNLVAGDYTVTVTGGTFKEGTNVGTVKVEAQKIGKIEFNSETLAKTGTGTATVSFKVFDQYGTDVTGSAQTLVNNVNWSANVAVDSLNDLNGVLTIDLQGATDFVKDQKILITAVDSATGVSKAVNFSVGDSAAVKTLSLGEVKLPTNTTRVYTGSASAATIEITAQDQYGNKLDKAAKVTGITILSSDAGVTTSVVDVDNKPVINVNTSALTTAKNVTLTVVINASGETVTKTIEVVKPAQPDTVTLGSLETNVVAATDAAGKFVLPITAVNQFGETMTAKQVAEAYSAGNLTVTGTGSLSGSTLVIDTNASSTNYGKVINNGAVGAAGVGTVVLTTATGKTASANFEVKAARKVVEILAPKTVTTNLVSGASSKFTYQYKDQYGDLITPAVGNTNTDLTWKFVVTNVTGDTDVISVDKTTGAAEESIGDVTVTSATGKAGTAKVAAQLLNASSEVVSQVETTFTVSANNATGLTYSISDVKTLYSNTTADTAVDGTDAYAAPLAIVAKDATGNELAIPTSQILKIESVKGYFVVNNATAPLGNVALDAQDNKFVIGAKDADTGSITWATGSNTVTDTVRVTLNTADGIKVLTKEVTISKEAPKTTELKIVDKAIAAANPYALAKDTKDVTALTFANLADTISSTEVSGTADADSVFVVTKDQYGVYSAVAKDFVVNSQALITLGSGDKFSTTVGGKFALTDGDSNTIYAAGKDITLSVFDGDYTDTLTVKINAIANNAAVAASLPVAVSGGTATITFDRPLNTLSQTAVLDAVKAKAVVGASGDATKVTYAWDAAGKVLTITNANTTAGQTVSFSADVTLDVTDVFGNKNSVTIDVTP